MQFGMSSMKIFWKQSVVHKHLPNYISSCYHIDMAHKKKAVDKSMTTEVNPHLVIIIGAVLLTIILALT